MRVLFVASGNAYGDLGPVVEQQAEGLRRAGVEVDSYMIKGRGVLGYLASVRPLRESLARGQYGVMHAHFAFSGFVAWCASLGNHVPVVTSLMGSDVFGRYWIKLVAQLFSRLFWKRTIVKSSQMAKAIRPFGRCEVIPNGVDTELFRPHRRDVALSKTGFDPGKKNLLFVATDLNRREKNYVLALKVLRYLPTDTAFHAVTDVSRDELAYYYSAADALVVSSLWEGSPNVVKEALACECPVISTDVGDVAERFGELRGCLIAPPDPPAFAECVRTILRNGERAGSRELIVNTLSMESISVMLLETYRDCIDVAGSGAL